MSRYSSVSLKRPSGKLITLDEGRGLQEESPPLVVADGSLAGPALLLALIHPSAWNRNSWKFAFTEFCEVRDTCRAVLAASK